MEAKPPHYSDLASFDHYEPPDCSYCEPAMVQGHKRRDVFVEVDGYPFRAVEVPRSQFAVLPAGHDSGLTGPDAACNCDNRPVMCSWYVKISDPFSPA